MPFQVSPGVSVVETDLTTIVPTISTTAAGFVGQFSWGPANEVRTISSENELREVYGDPDDDNFTWWFSAANFLRYGSNLQVVRAVSGDARNAAAGQGATSGIVGYPLSEKIDSTTGDIYSASKACTEIVTSAFRKTFYTKRKIKLASVRAGNVIGGGDYSKDRLQVH